MPITGPTSYIETTEDFLDHWAAVNTALGGTGLILRAKAALAAEDIDRGMLEDQLSILVSVWGDVADALNDLELTRADIDLKKAALLLRINQFNSAVRAELANTKWPSALPDAPSANDGADVWRQVLDDVESLWAKVNTDHALGGTSVLTLLNGYTLANFQVEENALREAFRAWRRAFTTAGLERAERNLRQTSIYNVLKAYRLAVPVRLGVDAPLVATLPKLTPEAGPTPAPVTATGVWDAAVAKAKVTYTASAAPNVRKYQLRGVPGPEYSTEDEVVLADHGPADPREFLSDFSLGLAGQVAGFRVVVILETGHEAGSEPVYVTKPGP